MSKIDLPTRNGRAAEPLMQEGDTFHMTFRKNGDYVLDEVRHRAKKD